MDKPLGSIHGRARIGQEIGVPVLGRRRGGINEDVGKFRALLHGPASELGDVRAESDFDQVGTAVERVPSHGGQFWKVDFCKSGAAHECMAVG